MTRQEKKKIANPKIVTDAVEVAEEAGLRYVSDDQPGYTRKARGDDFEYFDTEGKPIRDEQRLLRIKRLAIPPAYTDVWICPSANGHIQAMGRDARRRSNIGIMSVGGPRVTKTGAFLRLSARVRHRRGKVVFPLRFPRHA
jgi:DNA topoisomerase IB